MIKITGVIKIIGVDIRDNKVIDLRSYLQKHYIHYTESESETVDLFNISICVDYDNMVPVIWYILHHFRKDDFIKIIMC